MDKKTPEEISAEVAKLKELKPRVRRWTMFREDNHAAIEAQIEALERNRTEDDLEDDKEEAEGEDDWSKDDEHAHDAALEAVRWRDGDDDTVPSESWSVIATAKEEGN